MAKDSSPSFDSTKSMRTDKTNIYVNQQANKETNFCFFAVKTTGVANNCFKAKQPTSQILVG